MDQLTKGIQDCTDRVLNAWRGSGQQLLRLEGFMGAGKSSIAALISEAEGVPVLCPDDFATQDMKDASISGRIDLEWLNRAAGKVSKGDAIFEGVCLEELLPSTKFGRGFVVYVKRVILSENGLPMWQDEHELTANPAANYLIEDVRRYHRIFEPHCTADICFAVPEGCT